MFHPEIRGREEQPPQEQSSALIERRKELGRLAEEKIAIPLLKELKEVFSQVEHTSEIVDREKGVDLILSFAVPDAATGTRKHLAVQLSIAESREIWEEKVKRVRGVPSQRLLDIYGDLAGKGGRPPLTRSERLEEVPTVLLKIPAEAVEEAFLKSPQEPYSALPEKEKLLKSAILQISQGFEWPLAEFRENPGFARLHKNIPALVQERQGFFSRGVAARELRLKQEKEKVPGKTEQGEK